MAKEAGIGALIVRARAASALGRWCQEHVGVALEGKASAVVKFLVCWPVYLALCLFVMAGAGGAQTPQKEMSAKDYAQTYFQSFKGKAASPPGWELYRQDGQRRVRFEPEGLRLTLP